MTTAQYLFLIFVLFILVGSVNATLKAILAELKRLNSQEPPKIPGDSAAAD